MTDTCLVEDCDRPVSDAWCCTRCAWRLKQALKNVPALEEDLPIVLARLTRYTDQPDWVRSSRTPALPFHDPASEAAWILRNTLTTWARLVAEERGHQPPGNTLSGMANWLTGHIEWIRHHRAGYEAIDEITTAVHQAVRVTDRPSNRTTVAVGPCPELGCSGEIRAFIPAREDRPAFMVCDGCEQRWDSVMWLRLGRRVVAEETRRIAPYLDTAAAAAALGVTPRTIRRWIVNDPDRDVLGYPAGMGYAPSRRLTNHGTPARILLDLAEIEAIRTRRDGEMLA